MVRTYVLVILHYDQAMGRTLHVARVVVLTYVSSLSTIRPWGGTYVRTHRPLLRSDCGTYVRVILYYDPTVGRTLHTARVVVRTCHLYYDQTVGCTPHSAPIVVPAYVGLLRPCRRDAL